MFTRRRSSGSSADLSLAEQVSTALDSDGRRLATVDGRRLVDLCLDARASSVEHNGDRKWVFPDGSALVQSGSRSWDLALDPKDARCFCWESQGHHSRVCPLGAGRI